MNRSRTLPVAVSLTAAAALILSGCGGGDDKGSGNDKIAGAEGDSGKTSAEPADKSSEAPRIDRPKMELPSDVRLAFDKAAVSDEGAAALGDAQNFVRAVIHGIVKQDADDAAYKFYSEFQSPAWKYAKQQIQANIKAGVTVTGKSRYTRPQVKPVEGAKDVVVSFCSNDSSFYSKDVKSGKTLRTKDSLRDYSHWQIGMTPAKKTEGLWQAKAIQVKESAAQCRE
ncbi:hypothetical protein [Streptomyces sp. NRRL S-920]|uniref:hypothetical protein n=1 Tax=Streptomyces sp. NRRL S-920 TaxID=1463921 RepID=UPI0004C68FE3|nr:hypothetical protein [Streptomyces sp. NRRL S-920]